MRTNAATAVFTAALTAGLSLGGVSLLARAAHARSHMDMAEDGLALEQLPVGLTDLPREAPASRVGFALQLGGGLTGFDRQSARERFSSGGYWELRAVLGTRRWLGAEVAYIGSHRGAEGTGRQAALVGNGAEATLRAKLPLAAGGLRLEPFVFGGAGWSHYHVSVARDGRAREPRVEAPASGVVHLPVGSGLVMAHENLLLDLRLSYRATPGERALGSWAAGLTIGCEI